MSMSSVSTTRFGRRALAVSVAVVLAAAGFAITTGAQAATPQRLSATADGKLFESDDDGILYLVPTKGVLNLIAKTKGASAYPPPKTPVDSLSINCRNFDGKPRKFSFENAGSRSCEVTFTKGVSKQPFGAPEAEYTLGGGKQQLEITAVNGKVIEGNFSFELVEVKTKAKLSLTGGSFKAEDRQQ